MVKIYILSGFFVGREGLTLGWVEDWREVQEGGDIWIPMAATF